MADTKGKALSVKELLKPRYKTLVSYPDSPLRVGQIIDGETFNVSGGTRVHCKDYPAIFKPLQWWEEREQWQMPEYVKSVMPSSRVAKAMFDFNASSSYWMYLDGEPIPYDPNYFTPATHEEYKAYATQNKKP